MSSVRCNTVQSQNLIGFVNSSAHGTTYFEILNKITEVVLRAWCMLLYS